MYVTAHRTGRNQHHGQLAACPNTSEGSATAKFFSPSMLAQGVYQGDFASERIKLGQGPGQRWRETDRPATAAAIGRVVHHSVILEFDVPSYRTNAAQQRGQAEEVNRQE